MHYSGGQQITGVNFRLFHGSDTVLWFDHSIRTVKQAFLNSAFLQRKEALRVLARRDQCPFLVC